MPLKLEKYSLWKTSPCHCMEIMDSEVKTMVDCLSERDFLQTR